MLVLAACEEDDYGAGGEELPLIGEEGASAGEEAPEDVREEEEPLKEETQESDDALETMETEFGTYRIIKQAEDVDAFEVGKMYIEVKRAYLAEFLPEEEETELVFGEEDPEEPEVIHAFVTEIAIENNEEEFALFIPFAAELHVGDSISYDGELLSSSNHQIPSGGTEEFITAYDLEGADLAQIEEVPVVMWAPWTEEAPQEDLEFTVEFE